MPQFLKQGKIMIFIVIFPCLQSGIVHFASLKKPYLHHKNFSPLSYIVFCYDYLPIFEK